MVFSHIFIKNLGLPVYNVSGALRIRFSNHPTLQAVFTVSKLYILVLRLRLKIFNLLKQ